MRIYSSEYYPYFSEYREAFDYEEYDDYFDDPADYNFETDYPGYSGEHSGSAFYSQAPAYLLEIEKRFLDYEAGLKFPEEAA